MVLLLLIYLVGKTTEINLSGFFILFFMEAGDRPLLEFFTCFSDLHDSPRYGIYAQIVD